MKRLGLAVLFLLAAPHGASAVFVDFTTTSAVLSCGAAANCTPGVGSVISFSNSAGGAATLQVTYSANIVNDLDVDPLASANFGQLFLLCISCTGQTGSFGLAGASLTLNVGQGPDPFSDNGSFGLGALGGTLTLNNGSLGGVGQVSWASPAFVLSDGSTSVGYALQQPTPPNPAAYLLSIGSATTFQGLISAEEVPEPGTLGSLGCGLAALLLARRRRG